MLGVDVVPNSQSTPKSGHHDWHDIYLRIHYSVWQWHDSLGSLYIFLLLLAVCRNIHLLWCDLLLRNIRLFGSKYSLNYIWSNKLTMVWKGEKCSYNVLHFTITIPISKIWIWNPVLSILPSVWNWICIVFPDDSISVGFVSPQSFIPIGIEVSSGPS